MNRTLALLVLAAVALTGCDETDTRSDEEQIVGSWEAFRANVRVRNVPVGVPVLALTSGGDRSEIAFGADSRFEFVLDPADGRRLTVTYGGTTYLDVPLDQEVVLEGTYTLDEEQDQIRFSTLAQTTADDFELSYGLGAVDGLELIAEDPETIAKLLGATNAGVFAEIVTGGSISYSKADLN